MLVTNEILHSFINCKYKAYIKSKHQSGNISEYQLLYNQLKHIQKNSFEKTLSENRKLLFTNAIFTDTFHKKGIALNLKFTNANIDIVLDGLEIESKKNIIPLSITPFEKVMKSDKLLIAMQATFIQNEFNLQIESCKVVFGQNMKETKFRLLSFTKTVKKIINELNKTLSNSNAPTFFKNIHCQTCEFRSNCLEKLVERDDLSLLVGLKSKEILQKNNRGIFSVKQLSYSFRPKKNPYRKRKFLPELKALAIREGKTFIQEIPNIKEAETEVFLDFEGIIDRNSNYLIGVIIKTNNTEKEYSFWANNKDEEVKIFIQLIDILKTLKNFIIYHYGSYEIQALKTTSKNLPAEYQEYLKTIIDNSFNLLNVFAHNIYPPTYSNSLKEIARFLKFDWTDKEASGLQSTIWRYYWEIKQDAKLKEKLIRYNIEDCRALVKVKDWISDIPQEETERYSLIKNLKIQSVYKFETTKFINKELESINRFAYFNYQREKVFIKTHPEIFRKKITHISSRIKTSNNLKPNKIIEIPIPDSCPNCMGKAITKQGKVKRIVIDLKITKTGIKRFITLFHSRRYKCKSCLKRLTPNEFGNHSKKYGRILHCWVINHYVHYRVGYNKIVEILKETFGINYPSPDRTKIEFAEHYQSTFDEIFETLKHGQLLHIDETSFKLKEGGGYVWVFANMNTVCYIYRQTRESEFLQEKLKDFEGVLISDFYAGYDFINCPKQRCLIHLIRDLNDDLVKNQQNVEFKSLTSFFSELLNQVINTVNQYGLKKRNLGKHKKQVASFFKYIQLREFESEICERWQKKFLSFQNELFTFLDYNGVPWNNNNAEYAVKSFALYRRVVDGLATQKSIQEYLTLLSIHETCKYRRHNFLAF